MNTKFLKLLGLTAKHSGTSTGCEWVPTKGRKFIASYSPVDGNKIGEVSVTTREDYEQVVRTAEAAFATWRTMPAPKRGEIVRQYADALRTYKEPLGQLVSKQARYIPRLW